MRGIRMGLVAAVVVQIGAVSAVYGIDRVRKKRIPGGPDGFPALQPSVTKVADNEITAYTEGESLYRDMIQAIDSAKEAVYFETYVWRSDSVGHAFKDALYRAANRGVQVFVVYDGFGSFMSHPLFKTFRKHPNLHIHRVKEIRRGIFSGNLRRTGRTHRKILVIDERMGFVGGFNIGHDFGTEWRDTHIRIEGPAMKLLRIGFHEFWNTFRKRSQPELPEDEGIPWDDQISAAFNLPSHLLFPVRGQYLDAFRRATKNVEITTAYFIPDQEILRELIRAAHRGVEVQVLIPEYSNHILADWVARPFYGELLRAGVKIWLYKHAMIHSKTISIDSIRSIIGTANVDRLSMMGNFEVTVQIDSPEFAAQMEAIFANDLTTARLLTFEEWEGRSLSTRLLERVLRPMALIV